MNGKGYAPACSSVRKLRQLFQRWSTSSNISCLIHEMKRDSILSMNQWAVRYVKRDQYDMVYIHLLRGLLQIES